MALTTIGNQLTPGTPTEISFAADTGLPAVVQPVIVIGHMAASGIAASGSQSATGGYVPVVIANTADEAAAKTEADGYFGVGSELSLMIVAAVKANALGGTFPPITALPLLPADADWGSSEAALTAINKLPSAYVVSPYDANNSVLMLPLLAKTAAMSQAQRVENGQYGSIAVALNRSVVNPSSLYKYDTIYGAFQWLRDTGTGSNAPALSIGEEAASVAAQLAANGVPFNPVKNKVIPNIAAPKLQTDWISVGAGMESEVALTQGWSPLRVLPNGSVAQLRARTLRVTTGNGVTAVTSYFDVMDFNVLFFWRQTLVTRFNQPDFAQVKASTGVAKLMLSEVIRLAQLFQTQGMFQNIDNLAKQFKVERNVSDRSRFDVFTPVNVIPILAVIATNINATTQGDTLTL